MAARTRRGTFRRAPATSPVRRQALLLLSLAAGLALPSCADRSAPTAPFARNDAVAAGPNTVKVKVRRLHLSSNTLAIDGPAFTGDVTVANLGVPVSGILLRGEIVQGSAAREATSFDAECPTTAGELPSGTCDMSFSANVSNTAPGSGTLSPGAAVFVLHVIQSGGATETELASRNLNVTLAGAVTVSSLSLASTTLAIGGPATTYSAVIQNPGGSQQNIQLQGYIVQGLNRVSAGATAIQCGSADGLLPGGTCSTGSMAQAPNDLGLVPTAPSGPAQFELDVVDVGTNPQTVLATGATDIELVLDQPRISDVDFAIDELTIGGAIRSYSITLDNPTGGNVSGIKVQGWILQGTTTRQAAGGLVVSCGAGDGVLPPGSCTLTVDAVALATGSGTLAPGSATFEIDLDRNDGAGDVVLDSRQFDVTLLSLAPALVITKTADAPIVQLDGPLGFTITVVNSGGDAAGFHLEDPLPPGPPASPVSWVMDPATAPVPCEVSGVPGSQLLRCPGAGSLATGVTFPAGASLTIHLSAPPACGTYANTASYGTTDAGSGSASATTTVVCPELHVIVQPDAALVSAPNPIGFTIVVGNSGDGDANGFLLTDFLPPGTGVNWSIDQQPSDITCTIKDAPPNQELSCPETRGTLAAYHGFEVHVTSVTTAASCGLFNNTATAEADFTASVTSDPATTQVACSP